MDEGTFSIHGNEITFLTDMLCFRQGVSATYTWIYTGGNSVFKDEGNDACLDRKVTKNCNPIIFRSRVTQNMLQDYRFTA